MKTLITYNQDTWKKKLSQAKIIINSSVDETVKHLGKEFELEGKELSILLTGDKFIQELNREYRKHDKPTNVLSFPHMSYENGVLEKEDFTNVFGEIIISYDTLLREAEEQGKTFDNHFGHLVVHSILHLFGFDHRGEAEADIMEDLEVEILTNLGIENPYL